MRRRCNYKHIFLICFFLGITIIISQGYGKELICDRDAQKTYDRICKYIHDIRVGRDTAAQLVKIELALDAYAQKYPGIQNNVVLAYVTAGMLEPYDLDRAKRMYQQVIDSKDYQYAFPAESTLKQLEWIGKPVSIQFTAIDGKQVDISQMKGKIILIDFWATWCHPCVREIPNIVKLYKKYHKKGLEIIGIDFDEDKELLTQMIEKKQIPWPQYFDGKQWGNKFGQEFGITALPTMWLIDKTGNVVDVHTNAGLEDKIRDWLSK
ncbi:MAG: TlpA family protein disulfide reductase [bacterium]